MKSVMENKTNWFVRILVVVLALLIISLVVYNFFVIEPRGNITTELIVLLLLLIVLSLSEVFDSFSVGQLLTLKKEVKAKKEQVSELKEEKKHLLSLVIGDITVQKQSQSVGFSSADLKEILKVIQAPLNKIKEDKEKQKELEIFSGNFNFQEESVRNVVDEKPVEDIGLAKFISINNLDKYRVINQVQISAGDPISSRVPIYDAYIKTEFVEIFVEVKQANMSLMFYDTLYRKLNNVYYYRKTKGVEAYLQLILVDFDDVKGDDQEVNIREIIEQYFNSAIETGLLRIQTFKLSDEERKKMYR